MVKVIAAYVAAILSVSLLVFWMASLPQPTCMLSREVLVPAEVIARTLIVTDVDGRRHNIQTTEERPAHTHTICLR